MSWFLDRAESAFTSKDQPLASLSDVEFERQEAERRLRCTMELLQHALQVRDQLQDDLTVDDRKPALPPAHQKILQERLEKVAVIIPELETRIRTLDEVRRKKESFKIVLSLIQK